MKMTFNDIFIDSTKKGRKILKENYNSKGKIPIIDQGKNQISGFSDEKMGIYKEIPVIIFGDHTRIIKYVDYPFLLGADGVKILSIKTNKFIAKYLYYALLNYYIPDTGYNRHFKWLKNFTLNVNSIDEQKRIVIILDKIVTMIDKKKKQINLLEELVKSRFIEMFGDPIKNDKGWEQKFLEKISSFESKNITKYLKCNNLIWLLNLEDIERNTGKIIKKKMITKSEIPTSIIAFDENYVLYSKLRPYLNKVALPLEEGIGTSELIPIRPRDEVNRIYLFNVLTSESVLKFLKTKVSGAKMPRIIMSDFKKLKISLPGIKLQNEFADFATKIDKLKFEAEKSLKEMENLYESLMQKFFKQN